jgi:type II secretory pathway component GspD/PulD (secretin)
MAIIIKYHHKAALAVIIFLLVTISAGVAKAAEEAGENNAAPAAAAQPSDPPSITADEFISSKTAASAQAPQKTAQKNPNERITIDLRNIDIGDLFKILSYKTGLNILPSKLVTGRVNLYFTNVTFQDALDVILITQDLAADYKVESGIIVIMTKAEYKALYGREYYEKRNVKRFQLKHAPPAKILTFLDNLKSGIGKIIVDEATGTVVLVDIPEKIDQMYETAMALDRPTVSEIFNLKYAKAATVQTAITKLLTEGSGSITIDERTNSCVITDLPEKMKKLRKVMAAFDAEPKQVLLEGEIVQVTLSDAYHRGIDWSALFESLHDLKFESNFDISSLASSGKVTLGTFASDNYNVVIEALETFGDTKILSRPRLVVVNNEEASMLVGVREAYVTQSQSQGESTTVTSESIEYIDVGIKFKVVPTISPEGFVTMKIKPEVSEVSETVETSLGSRIPIVSTSEAETTVKVKDGTMAMIAGLIKHTSTNDSSGIPVLKNIPVIGSVFSKTEMEDTTTEIIIFVTPHLLRGDEVVS